MSRTHSLHHYVLDILAVLLATGPLEQLKHCLMLYMAPVSIKNMPHAAQNPARMTDLSHDIIFRDTAAQNRAQQ